MFLLMVNQINQIHVYYLKQKTILIGFFLKETDFCKVQCFDESAFFSTTLSLFNLNNILYSEELITNLIVSKETHFIILFEKLISQQTPIIVTNDDGLQSTVAVLSKPKFVFQLFFSTQKCYKIV